MKNRWMHTATGYRYLPPVASCPVCQDQWISDSHQDVAIGPLPQVILCDCGTMARHDGWRCWRCHAVLAENCRDVDLWVGVPVGEYERRTLTNENGRGPAGDLIDRGIPRVVG